MRIGAGSPLVLGSASPRRRELMALLDLPVVVLAADIDESLAAGEGPERYLERIVGAKLHAVHASLAASPSFAPTAVGVLVADTVVVAPDGSQLGKPGDCAQARAMIRQLAGASHEVRTRFALGSRDPSSAPAFAQTVATRVTFRALTMSEIEDYVAFGEGSDKAGAYAVQGRAAAFVERIDGSYTNVVGLPLCEAVRAMRGLGWLNA